MSETVHRLAGFDLVFSPHALEATQVRLFAASRHRSRRIHKKLVKRFGGEFRMQPCIWRMGRRIVAHPAFRAEFERQMLPQKDSTDGG